MKKKPSFSEENQKDVELQATDSVSSSESAAPLESASSSEFPAPPESPAPAPQPVPEPKPNARARHKIGTSKLLFLAALALSVSLAVLNEWVGKSNTYSLVRYNIEQFPTEQLPLLILQHRLRVVRDSLVGNQNEKTAGLTDLANLELLAGDESAAESHLLQAMPASTSTEQMETLLQLYVHQKRWQAAADVVDRYKLTPDSALDPMNMKRIAVVLDHVGRASEAEKYRRFYESHGQLRLSRSMKAGTSENVSPSESRKILIDMFDTTAQDAIMSMGCTLLACHRFEEARHCFQTIAKRQIPPPGPTTVSSDLTTYYQQKAAIVMLPITSMLMNDYKRAELEFPQALEIDRNELRGGLWFPVQSLLFEQYSRFLMHKGNVSEAKKYTAMAEKARLREESGLHRLWWKERKVK